MKIKVSEPETWKRVIDIEVPGEDVDKLCEEKLRSIKNKLRLPGFRPGKAPFPLIKQRYAEAVRAEAIEEMVQKSFKDACGEKQIDPVSKGEVRDLKAQAGGPLTFSIETEVDPPIEIRDYDRLNIWPTPRKATDDDINAAVRDLQERFAEFKDVERPAQNGDFVRIEYRKVVIDGQVRTDVTSPTHPVALGGEHRIKDFDQGLIGHGAGETVDISITFPENYSDAEVAGKTGEFSVAILAVQEKILPEVATFLNKLGDFANAEALREKLREQIEADYLRAAKNEAYSKAIDTLIRENSFDVPPTKIERFIDYLTEDAKKGQRPGDPIPTREAVDSHYREIAIRSIKRQRIIDYISNKEKITASQEEVDAEIMRLAASYKTSFDTLKQSLRQDGTTLRIREDIRQRKTLDFLIGELPGGAEK